MTGEFKVSYPSGNTFSLTGELREFSLPDGVAPVVVRSDGAAIMLDPRALVQRGGVIVYDPRARAVPPWAKVWLDQHREWPGILEIAG